MPEGARFDPRKAVHPRYDTALDIREEKHALKTASGPVGKTAVGRSGGYDVRGRVTTPAKGATANSPTKRHSPPPVRLSAGKAKAGMKKMMPKMRGY
jgi:hypothetical protein